MTACVTACVTVKVCNTLLATSPPKVKISSAIALQSIDLGLPANL